MSNKQEQRKLAEELEGSYNSVMTAYERSRPILENIYTKKCLKSLDTLF